jgi:hypothetical protein
MCALALLMLSLSLHVRLVDYADDDAYIHMRVARNLWLYGEPYFNRGEPVMASTSPLWVMLTSPAAAFGAWQPLIVGLLNALILVAFAVVWSKVYAHVVQSSKGLEKLVAGLVAFFTAASSSMGLMETPCALLLVGIGFLGVFGQRWWGVPSGIAAVMVRPECAVFCLATMALKASKRQAWRLSELAAGGGLAVMFVWYQLHEFGSLYPHTARAKEVVYDLTGAHFVRLAFISAYGEWIVRSILPVVVSLFILAAMWVIYSFQGRPTLNLPGSDGPGFRRDFALVFVIPSLIIFCVYAAKRVFIFPWYSPLILVPLHLAVFRLALVGVRSSRILSSILLVPLAIVTCQILASLAVPSCAPFFEAGARARHLRHIGGALAREFPTSVLMAPEIGGLGMEFTGKIIDAVGLASPEALAFHPLRVPEQRPTGFHGGVPAALVESEKPKLVVGLDAFMRDFVNAPVSAAYEIRTEPPLEPDDMAAFKREKVLGSSVLLIGVRLSEVPGVSQEP